MRSKGLLLGFLNLIAVVVWLSIGVTANIHAEATPNDCQRILCGPSGLFTRNTIPNTAGIDFSTFPQNVARPYKPIGRIWYVRPNGTDQAQGTVVNPVATIGRAIELAKTGDAIQVGDGTYKVAVDGGSGLVLDKPGLTLYGEHVAGAVLESGPDAWTAIEVSADNVTIDGFVIKAASAGYGIYYGRLDRPQRHLIVKNLIIEGGESGLSSVIPPNAAVNPQPVIEGLLVNHVLIHNASLIGFNCGQGPCNNMRLENMVVQMRRDEGIDNSGADAIAVENGQNILVFNVEVTGASADGLDFKATRVAVINVVSHDVARNGIKLWHGGDVVNALVYNTGGDASIVFDGGGTYRVLYTIVARHEYKNPGSAYVMSVAADNPLAPGKLTIQNSIFYENSAAIWVSGAFQLDVRNNIFFGSGNGQELVWQREPEVAIGEQVGPVSDLDTVGGGSGNLGFIDPKFVNIKAANFTLASGSPAVDSGLAATNTVDFDLRGHPRTVGKAPDLGPVEAQ
jgi:hypothetical protein